MATSTSISLLTLICLIMAVSFLFNGDAAPLNAKRPGTTLNDDVEIYVNGQKMTYEALKRADPCQDIKYVISKERMKTHINYLKDIVLHYESAHPFIPYLENILRYSQRKLDEADGAPYVTFDRTEFRTEYAKIFNGITRTPVQPPLFDPSYRQVLTALHRFRSAPFQIQELIMRTWMFLCQRIYLACFNELRTAGVENTADGSQEGSSNTTSANLRDSGRASGSNVATVSGGTRSHIDGSPSSSSGGTISVLPYVLGSLGAWKPEPDRPLDDSNESGEVAGSSKDDEHRHQNSGATELEPGFQDEDLSDFYIPPEIAEEEDPDWEDYFASFLKRLKKSPQDDRGGTTST
ncbi:hypothetical protein, conserved [Babesia ovata]|uniref:Uncharacterized protein n=1 Tax=Babesia ovata TaxID=189622 RepID=A0A2H6KBJ0_9APIC|nr:uncharacterized protein BOVATA_018530 [Babesia ovata]GBE60360.1 hypothetical protein, conserved [Babesia ovata]